MLETAVADAAGLEISDGPVWIEALPAKTYHTAQYGEVSVTQEKLQRMLENFKKKVRGQDIAVDFDHGMDRAKGNKAAGWYKDFDIRPSSKDPSQPALYAAVEFTEEAKKEITDKQWKYFSLEWDDFWKDNDGNAHQDVVIGGGITNRPIAKHTLPINFSESMWTEVDEDTRKAFAVWSTAFINNLPDSSFLYIEPGGKKDDEGKTVPRTNRHLPYKDDKGNIDLPHLRNAIARIPQMVGVSSDLKNRLQSKARSILSAQSKKSMSEAVAEAMDILTQSGFGVIDESVEWEHSEPGTGPAPRYDPTTTDPGIGQPVPEVGPLPPDPSIDTGSRRDPLPRDPSDPTAPNPNNIGGTLTPEELAALRKLLGLDENANLVEAVTNMFNELAPLRNAIAQTDQEKKFAEHYPHVWREHQELIERDRNTRATSFSESVKMLTRPEGDKQVVTNIGLSGLALEKVREIHKKFSEGSATLADFEDVVKTITQGGTVQYGEIGSSQAQILSDISTSTATGVQNVRKLFAEKIVEIQNADKLEYGAAIAEAAKRYPDLAAAYRVTTPA